jgi:secreted trypsin-like serine protease
LKRARVAALVALATALLAASPAQAVTGGLPPSREYPHMAALLDQGSQYCDASLVAPSWILTAGHCTQGVKAGNLTVEIGGGNLKGSLTERLRPRNETRRVDRILVHPKWNPSTLQYDVALLHLSSASTKAPIAIANPATQTPLWAAGKLTRVIGYGLPTMQETGTLFQTDVQMQSDAACRQSYAVTGPVDTATMVCAGRIYGVQDSCFGDSGGPLMVPASGTLNNGRLIQAGVVSWGTLCGLPTQYGVYARVGGHAIYPWVASQIRARRR